MAVAVPNPPCLSFCGGVAARPTAARSDADAIRARLLYKLGIYASPGFADAARHRKNKAGREKTQGTAVTKLPPAACPAPIKCGDGGCSQGSVPGGSPRTVSCDDPSSDGPRAELPRRAGATRKADAAGGPRPTVRFDPMVAVATIPSRLSYSPRARARLYFPPEERAAAAARCAVEFAYEGWDWRSVVEEGGMYVCGASGEYVHPVHVEHMRRVNPYL